MNSLNTHNIDIIISKIEEYISLAETSDIQNIHGQDMLVEKTTNIKSMMDDLLKAEGQDNFALNKKIMDKKAEIDKKIQKFGPDFSSILGSVINSLAKGFNSTENNQKNALNSFKEQVQFIKEIRQDGQELREAIIHKTSQRDEFLKNAPTIIAKLKEKDVNNKAEEMINSFELFTQDLAFAYSHTTMLQGMINHVQDGTNKLLKLRVAVLLGDAVEPGKYGDEIEEEVQDLMDVDTLLERQAAQRNIESQGLKEGLKSILDNKITKHRSEPEVKSGVQMDSNPRL